MRKIRYIVAMSVDGYIAGPNGEIDWIVTDPEVDFGEKAFAGVTSIVFSRTMKPEDHPRVTVVSELKADWVQALKSQSGKDIWLFGGSELFRAFLDCGLVDRIEVSVIPVLLGNGVPLLPPPYTPTKLTLVSSKLYRSGRVSLAYEVLR